MTDLKVTVEELHVYEAELEIQNEELIASRTQTEESRKKYFRHFDLAPVGLLRLNHQGIILEANILGAQMLGVNRALLGRTTRSFLAHVSLESLGAFKQHLELALGSSKMEMCELELRTIADIRTFVRMQSVASRGDGDTLDLYTTLTDLTERREIEHKLDLQKLIADAAVAEKELFFAMLSHELRTPLTPLLALVGELSSTPGRSADDLAALTIMRRNLDLEIHLVDDLLDLTRVTSGKLDLQFDATNLDLCLANAIEVCREDIANKWLDLHLDLIEGPVFVRGHASRLEQVFWNLIKNAVKFTSSPDKLTITMSRELPDTVTIEVRDTGIGLNPWSLSRIFAPFFQVENALKHRAGGLGLGLAICKSIVEAHGGTLVALSEGMGQGSSFRVGLPTIAPAGAAAHPKIQTPAQPLHREGLRLLLIEDHADTRQVLTRLLRRRGYEVQSAGSAAEARTCCEGGTFDLLITDISLPDTTGYEMLKELAAAHGMHGIAMSGFGSAGDRAKGEEAGFLEYLVKPVDMDTLDGAIQRAMAAFIPPVTVGRK